MSHARVSASIDIPLRARMQGRCGPLMSLSINARSPFDRLRVSGKTPTITNYQPLRAELVEAGLRVYRHSLIVALAWRTGPER